MVAVVVRPQPGANYVEIADEVYRRLPSIEKNLPQDVEVQLGFDVTNYIRNSIAEVQQTVFISLALVVLIIFLFLRDWRTTLIPVLAIPVSLVGAFFVMDLAGYSLNVLTLLAIVLAIGLVVDDAIVVLENIYAKIEGGREPAAGGHRRHPRDLLRGGGDHRGAGRRAAAAALPRRADRAAVPRVRGGAGGGGDHLRLRRPHPDLDAVDPAAQAPPAPLGLLPRHRAVLPPHGGRLPERAGPLPRPPLARPGGRRRLRRADRRPLRRPPLGAGAARGPQQPAPPVARPGGRHLRVHGPLHGRADRPGGGAGARAADRHHRHLAQPRRLRRGQHRLHAPLPAAARRSARAASSRSPTTSRRRSGGSPAPAPSSSRSRPWRSAATPPCRCSSCSRRPTWRR